MTNVGLSGEFYLFSRKGGVFINSNSERKLYILGNSQFNGTVAYYRFKKPITKIVHTKYIK
jgi:hypothetical protein